MFRYVAFEVLLEHSSRSVMKAVGRKMYTWGSAIATYGGSYYDDILGKGLGSFL